jgi:hypothetical protein
VGKLRLPVLLDFGSVMSLISVNYFELVVLNIQLLTTDLSRVTASGRVWKLSDRLRCC